MRINESARIRYMLEWAWGIIANASGGDWTRESPEWQEAAAKWRDAYHATLLHQLAWKPQSEVHMNAEQYYIDRILALEARVQQLEDGIDRALHKLGEPQPGYPAPVANAVDILRALASPQRSA